MRGIGRGDGLPNNFWAALLFLRYRLWRLERTLMRGCSSDHVLRTVGEATTRMTDGVLTDHRYREGEEHDREHDGEALYE